MRENTGSRSLISDFAVHCTDNIDRVVKIKTLTQRKKYALGNVLAGFYFLRKHSVYVYLALRPGYENMI